jgi:hypothetical protein
VIDAQRWLGIFWEDSMNDWAAGHRLVAQLMNLVYFYLHFPLIIAFGIWLYFFRRHRYTLTRDAFLASGAIALVIYWLYPVAPPRELPELAARFDPNAPPYIGGFLDTMQEYLGYAYDTQSTRAFVNPYAAMPSLHFGWDLLLGLAMIRAFWGERWLWVLAPIGAAAGAADLLDNADREPLLPDASPAGRRDCRVGLALRWSGGSTPGSAYSCGAARCGSWWKPRKRGRSRRARQSRGEVAGGGASSRGGVSVRMPPLLIWVAVCVSPRFVKEQRGLIPGP